MTTRTMKLGELFTEEELARARQFLRKGRRSELESDIVKPIMARINAVTGQENDSRYMAYVLEYAINGGL
jgi:hypothetical protein